MMKNVLRESSWIPICGRSNTPFHSFVQNKFIGVTPNTKPLLQLVELTEYFGEVVEQRRNGIRISEKEREKTTRLLPQYLAIAPKIGILPFFCLTWPAYGELFLLLFQSKTNTPHTADLLMCKLNTQAKKIRQHHSICSKWPQLNRSIVMKQQLILKWIMIPTTLLVRGCQCRFMITSQVHESLFPTVLIYPLNFVSNPREHSDWNCVCDSVTFGAKRIVQGVALEFLLSRVIQGRFIVETLLFSLGNWPRYKTNSLLSWQFVFRSWCELEGSLQERIARPTKFVARSWKA